MQNAELIQVSSLKSLVLYYNRRDSGSTGVHAALLAPSGAVHAVGSTRRRQSPRQRQYGRSRRPLSAASLRLLSARKFLCLLVKGVCRHCIKVAKKRLQRPKIDP